MRAFSNRLQEWFYLDNRSLALARIGFGLSVFVDMLWRLTSAEWHYTDVGVVPRSVFIGEFAFPWSLSFHHANGSLGFAVLMLVIHGLAALLMAVGWKTRWMTALVAVLNISLHNRNWYVNNGGDDLLRVIMFSLAFMPWGEMYSVDQWLKSKTLGQARRVSGTWVWVLFLQAFVVYYVSYILKTSPIWRSEYSAIYYSSHLDIFATSIGRFIRQFPWFLTTATFLTIMLEWMGPLALSMGWVMPKRWQGWLRFGTVLAFWGLHIGIILTMSIGLFPFYCLAMWALFLPSEFWQVAQSYWPRLKGAEALEVSQAPQWQRFSHQFAGGFIFLTIFFWNLNTLKPPLKVSVPFFLKVSRWLHLYQEWNMFAPFPKQENLWMEIPAELEDGTTIELISGEQDVLGSKEASFPGNVPHEHWRKFYMNLADNEKLAKHYAGAWCRMWNRDESEGGKRPRLRRFSINVFHHVIQPNYTRSPLVKKVVWNHFCFSQDLPQGENPKL
jgi:hypothetical protein